MPARIDGAAAFRALGWFWAAVLAVVVIGVVALQLLGPPAPKSAASGAHGPAEMAPSFPQAAAPEPPTPAMTKDVAAAPAPSAPPRAAAGLASAASPQVSPALAGRVTPPGPIPAPDPALLQPAPNPPG